MSNAAIVRLRDDVWTIRAAAIFTVGLILIGAGLVPWVGPSVAAIGAATLAAAVAIVARGIGLDIDLSESRLVVRYLARSRQIGFDDVSYVGIEPSRPDPSATAWRILGARRYDVVINVRGAEPVIVRRDVTLADARSTVRQLKDLTGASASEGPAGAGLLIDKQPANGGRDANL